MYCITTARSDSEDYCPVSYIVVHIPWIDIQRLRLLHTQSAQLAVVPMSVKHEWDGMDFLLQVPETTPAGAQIKKLFEQNPEEQIFVPELPFAVDTRSILNELTFDIKTVSFSPRRKDKPRFVFSAYVRFTETKLFSAPIELSLMETAHAELEKQKQAVLRVCLFNASEAAVWSMRDLQETTA